MSEKTDSNNVELITKSYVKQLDEIGISYTVVLHDHGGMIVTSSLSDLAKREGADKQNEEGVTHYMAVAYAIECSARNMHKAQPELLQALLTALEELNRIDDNPDSTH